MESKKARFATRLFCDDIRQEVGNKLSIIGIYTEKVLLAQFPAALPKLCAFATVCTPRDRPFSKLVIRVFRDETLLIELPAPESILRQANSSVASDSPKKLIAIHGFANIVPMPFEERCQLRMEVETEEGLLELDPMAVELEQASPE